VAEIIRIPVSPVCNDKIIVERHDIGDNHPVAIAHDVYMKASASENWAPTIASLLSSGDSLMGDYLMILAPRLSFGEPDCRIILRGGKIPGPFDPESSSGCSYSSFLKTETEIEPATLLSEIFFSLVTRHVLMAEARLPFKTSLSVATYRGIFPVWNDKDNELWAAFVCAPKYVELRQ
jgi:hypothetical protein